MTWHPYVGPAGGRGWRHEASGEIRFQTKCPGEDGFSIPIKGDSSSDVPEVALRYLAIRKALHEGGFAVDASTDGMALALLRLDMEHGDGF